MTNDKPILCAIDRAFREFCIEHKISCVAVFSGLTPAPGGVDLHSGCGIYIGRDVLECSDGLKGTFDALGSGLADVAKRLGEVSDQALRAKQKNEVWP